MLLYNQFVYALGEVSQLLLQLGEEKQGCQWQVRTAWEMVKQLNSMPLFFLENWQAPSLRGWGSYPCATSSPLYSISGLFILKAFKNSSVLLPCTEGLLSVFHLEQMPCSRWGHSGQRRPESSVCLCEAWILAIMGPGIPFMGPGIPISDHLGAKSNRPTSLPVPMIAKDFKKIHKFPN